MKQIFLFAGEKSGDHYGARLVAELKKAYPDARVYGVGGPKMRHEGLECIMEMEKFEVMGFVDVFFALPRLFYQFQKLKKLLLKQKPDLVLTIDYPGFNFALAKSLYKRAFPGKLVHYICPSVWAWGKRRIPKMEEIFDHLFVIFPFEKKLFNEAMLPVTYVGHPLAQEIAVRQVASLDVQPSKRVVAIFPGSRKKELFRNLPTQLRVLKKLRQKHENLLFVVSMAHPSFSLPIEQILKEEGFLGSPDILLIDATQNPSLMRRAEIAIAKSGTNNLELALYSVPTVVTYGIGPLDLFIAKHLLRIRLPFYCIANIVANTQVFPELIGPNFTEQNLYKEADFFLSSPKNQEECRKKCLKLHTILDKKAPEQEIRTSIESFFEENQRRPI